MPTFIYTINLYDIVKVKWVNSWKTFGAVAVITLRDCSDVIITQPQQLEEDLNFLNSKSGYGLLLPKHLDIDTDIPNYDY